MEQRSVAGAGSENRRAHHIEIDRLPRIPRSILLVSLALAAPILPFVVMGDELTAKVDSWLDPQLPRPAVAALVAGVLATDILLPVPSSVVSTFGGAQLGVLTGTLVSWLGMTVGAIAGFWLARLFGRPLAVRLSGGAELANMTALAARHGPWLLAMTRAVPVLAEASVLTMGATGLTWRRFLAPVALANLGIAAVYSACGHFASQWDALPLALAASIALPVLAATMARRLLPRPEDSP
jgi:uncharacterized membrane protein YdjX (TVP38/TMEM64 family)